MQLDATKSPLALLAQTCSAIGRDTRSAKREFITRRVPSCDSSKDHTTATSEKFNEVRTIPQPGKRSPVSIYENETNTLRSNEHSRKGKREMMDNAISHSPNKKLKTDSETCKQSSDPSKHCTTFTASKDDTEVQSRTKRLDIKSETTKHGIMAHSTAKGNHSTSPPSNQEQFSSTYYKTICYICRRYHMPGGPCIDSHRLTSPMPFYPLQGSVSPYSLYSQLIMNSATKVNNTMSRDPMLHVCNWVSREAGTCGQRFPSAEDLFAHLRSHAVSNKLNSDYFGAELDKMTTTPYAALIKQQAAVLAAMTPMLPNVGMVPYATNPFNRTDAMKTPSVYSPFPSLPIPTGVPPYSDRFSIFGTRMDAATTGYPS